VGARNQFWPHPGAIADLTPSKDAPQRLAAGEADAAVYNAALLRYQIAEAFPVQLRVLPLSLMRQNYGLALADGSDFRVDIGIALLTGPRPVDKQLQYDSLLPMTFKRILLLLVVWLALLALSYADQVSATEPAPSQAASSAEDSDSSVEQDAEPRLDQTPVPATDALAFDPADIGLPGLPQPIASEADLRGALALIDARITEQEAALAEAETLRSPPPELVDASDAEAPDNQDTGTTVNADAEADAPTAIAVAADLSNRLELLRQLRVAVQRRATLYDRLAAIESKISQGRKQLESLAQDGPALEPPFLISQVDQQQAELSLKQAVEGMAETRRQTATRRVSAVERQLATAVRERRAARDRLVATEDSDVPDAERDSALRNLELMRLNELLARQQLAAAEATVQLGRAEDQLAEVQQSVLLARMAYLEPRAKLPRDVLEQRLAELTTAEEALYAQIDALQAAGDQAESALYQARRRLSDAEADADTDADQTALSEWVAARQAELDAARASVDALTTAMDNLNRMRALWQQRYELMENPEMTRPPALLKQLITEAATARAEKDALEGRLNALRSIQLAHARRLRDPALPESLREAMEVRSAAHDVAEQNGRELLETQDDLIALLQGMRRQLEALVKEQNLSLRLLKAQETLADWWDAELIVIDDQSIRARELVTALVVFVIVVFMVSLIRMAARRALKRRKTRNPNAEYGDLRLVLSAIAGNTNQLFVLIAAFYVAMTFSGLASPTVKDWVWTVLVVAFYAQLGIWANAAMADYFSRRRTRQEMRDPSTVTGYGVMMVFIRVGIWFTVIVSLLAYFKYPVAGLVGALGVGSLAIAFAVQNILGDVFSSMAIILDKPFRVGDFIKTGEHLGTIEHIGVKTTRIRSLSGEQLIVSNSDLLNSRIHNFKQFRERRVVFRVGVVYQTPRALVEQIPAMLREAVEEQATARFDRAHFCEFGDYALTFEVVYYVLSPDFAIYMDTQQEINLGIHRRFEAAGVSFAYPTQELILRRGPASMTIAGAAP